MLGDFEIAEVCGDVRASSGRAEVLVASEHLCFFFGFLSSATSVQKKIEGVEREDACLRWKENLFHGENSCFKSRNDARGGFGVRAEALKREDKQS